MEALNQNKAMATDGTTPAVYDIIRTLDGEGTVCAGTINQTTETTVETQAGSADTRPKVGQAAEGLNSGLEERLIDADIFGRHSMAQRRVLGCLACKLGSQPGNTGAVRSLEIAECQGAENSSVRRVLGKLVQGGFLKTEKRETPEYKGKPPDYFRLTGRAVQFAFKRNLQAPGQCGLNTGEDRRFNGAAEALLIEKGILEKRGSVPRALLGCLACKLQTGGEGVHAYELKNCTGVNPSHSLFMLRRLVEGGVLKTEPRTRVGRGAPQMFEPADTEVARQVLERLEIPAQCGLEDRQT
jgi:hypothetical protein